MRRFRGLEPASAFIARLSGGGEVTFDGAEAFLVCGESGTRLLPVRSPSRSRDRATGAAAEGQALAGRLIVVWLDGQLLRGEARGIRPGSAAPSPRVRAGAAAVGSQQPGVRQPHAGVRGIAPQSSRRATCHAAVSNHDTSGSLETSRNSLNPRGRSTRPPPEAPRNAADIRTSFIPAGARGSATRCRHHHGLAGDCDRSSGGHVDVSASSTVRRPPR